MAVVSSAVYQGRRCLICGAANAACTEHVKEVPAMADEPVQLQKVDVEVSPGVTTTFLADDELAAELEAQTKARTTETAPNKARTTKATK